MCVRDLGRLRWGLVPGVWAERKGQRPLINARVETLATQSAFAESFRERRCLIPADGFYEWKGEKGEKTPYIIRRTDNAPFAFAGLWESWRGQPTAAIVTCEANSALAPIHERMPVVLAPDDWPLWLGEAGHHRLEARGDHIAAAHALRPSAGRGWSA